MATLTPTTTGRRGKIDPVKAYQLRVQHRLSYKDIAEYFGVEKAAVIQRLQRFSALIHNQEDKSNFEAIRVQAMTTLEEQMMASLADPEKLAKASLNNVAYAFQQIHTARRLEEGKSTENHAVLGRLMGDALKRVGKSTQVVDSTERESSGPT